MGMTAEQLDHLYEPFNRLGRERGGIEGTGIGLALTRQLVRLMHGELQVASDIGRGTRASVNLGFADVPDSAATRQHAANPPTSIAQTHGTVLYIEDNEVNEVNVMLVEQMLAHFPELRFVHAADGQSGLEQAIALQPDLVLLDMQLPDMSGLDVLSRLRADIRTRSLRVVALSASAMPEEVERARSFGADDYWTKPLDFDAFVVGVADVLARRRAAA
jgi:CheY-like chemotaxis protein